MTTAFDDMLLMLSLPALTWEAPWKAFGWRINAHHRVIEGVCVTQRDSFGTVGVNDYFNKYVGHCTLNFEARLLGLSWLKLYRTV